MDSVIHAIIQASVVSKGVLLLLLSMSVASWACMAGKWLSLRAAYRLAASGLERFDTAGSLEASLPALTRDAGSPLFGITRRAVREFNRINRTGDTERLLNDNVRRALRFGVDEEMARLKSSLALLATTANTAPFIGLFGTVWGIMYSFQAIALMKSVSLATVAPGIAEALIATAIGLFVAIPATCGYNIFRSRLSFIEGVCVIFAGQLLNRMQHEAAEHKDGLVFAGER
ncbi:MAG: MotA/TolQ/ExbB proton channel family protein [Desulfovibrio sp.]|jgi:biopolymer transport protein TolQ|nr:MotA/TolQ/ExbB proton channel family protein [Desulfovibrio sp.]